MDINLEKLQEEGRYLYELRITRDAANHLRERWDRQKVITHYRHGRGGRNGGGPLYIYTPSFRLCISSRSDKCWVSKGGATGDLTSERKRELQKAPDQPLEKLYQYLKRCMPESVLAVEVRDKHLGLFGYSPEGA